MQLLYARVNTDTVGNEVGTKQQRRRARRPLAASSSPSIMAHFGDGMPRGADDVFSPGAVSNSVDHRSKVTDNDALSSADNIRAHLQTLLDDKEKQLQQAGTLGQRVLAQQMELEERIRQLQEMDSDINSQDEPSTEMRMRYHELISAVKSWDEENAQLSTVLGGLNVGKSFHETSLHEFRQESVSQAPSASQSRRAKDAAHRANDVGKS